MCSEGWDLKILFNVNLKGKHFYTDAYYNLTADTVEIRKMLISKCVR